MPYIKDEDRDRVLTTQLPTTSGELNYLITTFCLDYLLETDQKYRDYNEIIGVLECVKQEFYRRAVVPYEEKRKEENGDVFE